MNDHHKGTLVSEKSLPGPAEGAEAPGARRGGRRGAGGAGNKLHDIDANAVLSPEAHLNKSCS